jgi:serine hydrolase
MSISYFTIPGDGNSGPKHWQTYFEKTWSNVHRINQKEWDAPTREDWIDTIENTLSSYDLSQVILVGHSLGCSAIAHWAAKYNKIIKGAFFVAVGDVDALPSDYPAKGFSPMPTQKLKFKSIVVASNTDPWVTLTRAKYFADCWGSEFMNIGDAGHINVDSGYGNWNKGLEILKSLE